MRRRLSPPHPFCLSKSFTPHRGPPMGGGMGGPHGGPMGGKDFFDKLKGCGGESLRRLFRFDFYILEFFTKSIFEEFAQIAQNQC